MVIWNEVMGRLYKCELCGTEVEERFGYDTNHYGRRRGDRHD